MTQSISFDVTSAERMLIRQIVARAVPLYKKEGVEIGRIDTQMDITAVHANGCPLDLQRLLAFDEFNFCHDISGIAISLNRETGELSAGFRPRCAKPVEMVEL